MIELSLAAKNYLKEELEESGFAGMVIDIVPGGCSGLQYKFFGANEKQDGDEEIDFQDFKIFIRQNAVLFVVGTMLDYENTATGSKLVFNNPNAKRKCGCGKSFRS